MFHHIVFEDLLPHGNQFNHKKDFTVHIIVGYLINVLIVEESSQKLILEIVFRCLVIIV